MKKIIISLLLFSSLLYSCTSINLKDSNDDTNIIYEEQEAYKDFAIILSKAAYCEPELRSFIKEEALKEIDKDYDVFYPWVKDKLVNGSVTFRDILKRYDVSRRLGSIERTLPLLTILVPEWSWVHPNAFSVKTWDTSEKTVAVSYDSHNINNPIYHNGFQQEGIPSGIYPEFPVLIVKSNERMNVDYETKGGLAEYSFIDQEYDGREETREKPGYYTIHFDFSTPSAATFNLGLTTIPQVIIDAYSEGQSQTLLKHRDHIYYNMTANVDTGYVNNHYGERIYKCKINPSLASGLIDDSNNSAGGYSDWKITYNISGNHSNQDSLSVSQMANSSWVEGAIELIFRIYAGSSYYTEKHKTIHFNEAFSVARVYERYRVNWLGAKMWRYYYMETQDIVPKWVTCNFNLFTWNLQEFPTRYRIKVEEYDKTVAKSRTDTTGFNMSTNITIGGEKIGWSTILGGGFQTTQSVSYQEGDDVLGEFYVDYTDPIITSKNNYMATIYPYTTGVIDVMMLPALKY